jgi:hypothetical protein
VPARKHASSLPQVPAASAALPNSKNQQPYNGVGSGRAPIPGESSVGGGPRPTQNPPRFTRPVKRPKQASSMFIPKKVWFHCTASSPVHSNVYIRSVLPTATRGRRAKSVHNGHTISSPSKPASIPLVWVGLEPQALPLDMYDNLLYLVLILDSCIVSIQLN